MTKIRGWMYSEMAVTFMGTGNITSKATPTSSTTYPFFLGGSVYA